MFTLVTGAAGFLGRSVIPALLQKGHHVRALVRATTAVEQLGWPREVEVVRADLRERAGLDVVVRGIDAVIHLAAAMTGSLDEQRRSNVDGTSHLLDAMVATGVRRLVLASSVAVYDWHQAVRVLDETTPFETRPQERDAYCRSKLEQEQLVRMVSTRCGFVLTVLRPGFVWGAGRLAIGAIGRSAGPFLLRIGSKRTLALTYVENCGALFAQVVDDERAAGRTFNVVDIDHVTVAMHAALVVRLSSPKRVTLPITYELFRNGVRLLFPLVRIFFKWRHKLPGLLVPRQFEAQFKPLQVSTSRLAELLRWQAPYSYAQAVEKVRAQFDLDAAQLRYPVRRGTGSGRVI